MIIGDNMNIKSVLATADRNFTIKTRAYPFEFFFGSLLECFINVLGAFFIYKLLFNENISNSFAEYAGTNDYISYIILGGVVYMFAVGTMLNVSRSLMTEMREGTLECLLITPFSLGGYFVGNMLEQTFTTALETAIALLICYPFGLNLSNINVPSLLVCGIISLIGIFGMSIILCNVMVFFRDTFISQNTVFSLVVLLSGVSFPIEYLPKYMQIFSNFIPVTYSLKLLRGSILSGKTIFQQQGDIIILLLLSMLYCIIGLLTVKGTVKKAMEYEFF